MVLKSTIRSPAALARDGGYALVVAVIAVALFAYLAFQVLANDQGAVAVTSGRLRQARLAAAADAGVDLAIHGLAADDRGVRWSIDGRPRRVEFDGVDLTITVVDERGKAPLNAINDDQARALFAGAGATGERLDALVNEFHDWQREAVAASNGRSPEPAAADAGGIRHGPFRTVGEMAALKDMTPAILARIAPAVTVFFEENGPFEPGHASAIARAAMSGLVPEDAAAVAEADRLDNQRPEVDLGPDDRFVGRTLTISVIARDKGGAQTHRGRIVELTGDRAHPYWIRYAE